MKCGILYGCTVQMTRAHRPVHYSNQQIPYWVRMGVVDAPDLIEALDKAKPIEGETVLNTVELS